MSVGFLLSGDLVQSLKQEGSSEIVYQPAMKANWFGFWMLEVIW